MMSSLHPAQTVVVAALVTVDPELAAALMAAVKFHLLAAAATNLGATGPQRHMIIAVMPVLAQMASLLRPVSQNLLSMDSQQSIGHN